LQASIAFSAPTRSAPPTPRRIRAAQACPPPPAAAHWEKRHHARFRRTNRPA
jgi:hypothetical protein